ncbi:zinc-binding dehydrogenase [Corynebacterium sphenisci]|uniref:zinc-binding dehydrogenase n=1 Tax=Corynebacterium sphenisci TaxID=191493 RepID=UPI0026E0E765|nr:zinc-binding dehydrogenase [Corynebacterium sphenisci]MDO5731306.1 zinc-binding dehydrogenase [Corynebacterium sphenisci]
MTDSATAADRTREVRLARVPAGPVTAGDFALAEAPAAAPRPGEALVGLRMLGLNAGLAGRLGVHAATGGRGGVDVGGVPESDALVEVLDPNGLPGWAAGDPAVVQWAPWRERFAVPAGALRPAPVADPDRAAENLTVLGHVGFTAFIAVHDIARLRPGERLLVSAAAGGVGAHAVQFARALGAEVVGVAGSAERMALLADLGAVGVDRRAGDLAGSLAAVAPGGFDVYLDAVGGPMLETGIDLLRDGGRVVLMGAAGESGGAPRPPRNYKRMIHHELSMTGFTVLAHEHRRAAFEGVVRGWLAAGRVRPVATVHSGLAAIPGAFADLMAGAGAGRTIVDLR